MEIPNKPTANKITVLEPVEYVLVANTKNGFDTFVKLTNAGHFDNLSPRYLELGPTLRQAQKKAIDRFINEIDPNNIWGARTVEFILVGDEFPIQEQEPLDRIRKILRLKLNRSSIDPNSLKGAKLASILLSAGVINFEDLVTRIDVKKIVKECFTIIGSDNIQIIKHLLDSGILTFNRELLDELFSELSTLNKQHRNNLSDLAQMLCDNKIFERFPEYLERFLYQCDVKTIEGSHASNTIAKNGVLNSDPDLAARVRSEVKANSTVSIGDLPNVAEAMIEIVSIATYNRETFKVIESYGFDFSTDGKILSPEIFL